MTSKDPVIVPTKDDYLKRARLARNEAKSAASPQLREGFLKLADEWERIASTVADDQVLAESPERSPARDEIT